VSAAPGGAAPLDMRHVVDEREAAACYPVMRELRPHLTSPEELAARWRRQTRDGYRLLAVWRGAAPVALAGFRLQENLLHGRHVHVDDLVASAAERRVGHGRRLLEQVAAEARALGCAKLTLGAAMGNALGHRFYFRFGLLATGLGFSMPL
jgi:GNAT superfamily N-acetyltransferase